MSRAYRQFFEVFLLSLMWGPSFLWNRMASAELGPFSIATVRIALGTLFLLVALWLWKTSLRTIPRRIWLHSMVLGFFANGFPWVCFAEGVRHIPISISALINGTVPLVTVILANLFLTDEKLSRYSLLGILLGMGGFLVIALPPLLDPAAAAQISGMNDQALWGMSICLIGSISYAIAIVYAKRFVSSAPPLVVPTLQLLSSLVYLIPLMWWMEAPQALLTVSAKTWGILFLLGIFATMFAFLIYHRVIRLYGATASSMVTYLLPIIGTILGIICLNETIDGYFWLAAIMIFSGLFVINVKSTAQPIEISKLGN